LSIFFAQSVAAIFRPPYRVGLLFNQLEFMAYGSLFVVGLTGLFTGMVLALQFVYAFGLFNAQSLGARRSSLASRASSPRSSPASSSSPGWGAPSPPSSAACASPSRSMR